MLDAFEMAHLTILIIIVFTAIYAVMAKDLLVAVISMSIMSLLVSLEFYLLQAPDVAIAEASIGAALTAAIFIVAIKATKRMEEE
ncbi:MAG TPA: DUF4040 domain-containing protein [Thermoplasmata archaeon]|nr:DUF4040 domain-containing protein [Thermoplasmata archaeon]